MSDQRSQPPDDPYWGSGQPDGSASQSSDPSRGEHPPAADNPWATGADDAKARRPLGATDNLVTGNFGDWFGASISVVLRSWRSMGVILLVGVTLPSWIFGNVQSFNNIDLNDPDSPGLTTQLNASGSFLQVLLSLALLYLTAVAWMAATRTAAAEAAGGFLGLGEAFRYGFKRGWKLWLWLLVAGVTVAVGILLLVIPGLWALIWLSVIVPAAVFEWRRNPYARSFQLVHSAFWGAAGRLIVAWLVGFLAALIIQALGLLLVGLWVGIFAGWLAGILIVLTQAAVALALLVPAIWLVSTQLCTYAFLRGRAEAVSATSLSADAASTRG